MLVSHSWLLVSCLVCVGDGRRHSCGGRGHSCGWSLDVGGKSDLQDTNIRCDTANGLVMPVFSVCLLTIGPFG